MKLMRRRQISLATYWIVWAVMLGLAIANLLASRMTLGAANAPVALGLAAIEAILIIVVFMHLIEQRAVSAWALVLGLVFASILWIMVGADVLTRSHPGVRPPGLATEPAPTPGGYTIR